MRIVCHLSGDLSANFAVRILLQEPKKCQYLLVLQSALFCSYMTQMNEYGVYSEPSSIEKMLREALSKYDETRNLQLKQLDGTNFMLDSSRTLSEQLADELEDAVSSYNADESQQEDDEQRHENVRQQKGNIKRRPTPP